MQEKAVTNSTPQSIQRFESLTRDLFDKGMAYLEAAKQESFSRETLGVWFNEMTRLGWSAQKFRERVLSVLQSQTFGRISFDMFLTAEGMQPAKPKSLCVIHNLRYDDHCPRCWSETAVPMPEDVKEAIRKLEDELTVKRCKRHKRDYTGSQCPDCAAESKKILEGK